MYVALPVCQDQNKHWRLSEVSFFIKYCVRATKCSCREKKRRNRVSIKMQSKRRHQSVSQVRLLLCRCTDQNICIACLSGTRSLFAPMQGTHPPGTINGALLHQKDQNNSFPDPLHHTLAKLRNTSPMAIVLDAFASYLSDLLKQVAEDEVDTLLGVQSQISSLGEKLQLLKDFLADAERKRITDKYVERWVGKLKGVMYQATDILELCQLKAMERGVLLEEASGCWNPLLFCLWNPLFAHDIGRRIKELNRSLDDIKKQGDDFKFANLGSYEDRRLAPPPDNRKTSPVLELSSVVGEKIEEDTRELVELLTKKGATSLTTVDNKMMVVAIVGIGGIGKTTLAKKIFHDATIQDNFDMKVWLSVTQNFSESDMLRTAITSAGAGHLGDQEKSLLEPALVSAIKEKKFLLVLDDMWSEKEWNNLLRAPFSYGAQGSRVLVTTRDERVARGMQAMHLHHIDKLVPEDAWLLLKKQVTPSEIYESNVETLKDIGMEILGKCDGLPLAIKVLGGLLCRRDLNRDKWEKVLHDSTWSAVGMPDELNHALYLSYDDLSPHLKQCFLHYSLIPKNVTLHCDRIIGMWISEGFVHRSTNELEELGRDYYDELIVRNLIEPTVKFINQQHCVMHDVVRSFAHYVARDEALVAHNGQIDIRKHDLQTRLSIHNPGLESNDLLWTLLHKQKSLRTLMSFGPIFKIKPGDSMCCLSSLRILLITSKNCAPLVDSLCQLKLLRYLSLDRTDISGLPHDIGNMRFLQHISLRNCKNLVQLPASIVRLGQLRYLDIHGTKISNVPRGFSGLTKLRSIYGYPSHSHFGGVSKEEDWCSLEELGPLSELRVLALRGLDVPSSTFASKVGLSTKKHLTELSLGCTKSRLGADISEEEKQQIEEVFEELCPAPSLEILDIHRYFGRRLPNWMTPVTLTRLRFLLMEDLSCCTQLPSGLCQLPYLQILQIDGAPAIKRVGPEFLQPYHHYHTRPQVAVGFPKLDKLMFIGMVEWKEWEWKEQVGIQALPVLEILGLQGCKLRHFPPDLTFHLRGLKLLQVFSNPNLERIANFPKLHELQISKCPKIKVLEGVPALRNLLLGDYNMESLPEYVKDVELRYLELECNLALLSSMAMGKDGPEWDKFSHIQRVKAYANDGDTERKWYVLYTREPYYLETNIIKASSSEKDAN